MKAVVQKKDLDLVSVFRLNKRDQFPLEQPLVIEAKDSSLRLSLTGNTYWLKARIPAEIEQEGRFLVDPVHFIKAVKEGQSRLLLEAEGECLSIGDRVVVQKKIEPGTYEKDQSITATIRISRRDVLAFLERPLPLSKKSKAFYLHEPRMFSRYLVSSDGQRLHLYEFSDRKIVDGDPEDVEVAVPENVLKKLHQIAKKVQAEQMEVKIYPDQAVFCLGDWRIGYLYRDKEERFPDFQALIAGGHRFKVQHKSLMKALEALIEDIKNDVIAIKIDHKGGRICNAGNKEVVLSFEAECLDNASVFLLLRALYLKDALLACNSPSVIVQARDMDHPINFLSQNCRVLVMGINIQDFFDETDPPFEVPEPCEEYPEPVETASLAEEEFRLPPPKGYKTLSRKRKKTKAAPQEATDELKEAKKEIEAKNAIISQLRMEVADFEQSYAELEEALQAANKEVDKWREKAIEYEVKMKEMEGRLGELEMALKQVADSLEIGKELLAAIQDKLEISVEGNKGIAKLKKYNLIFEQGDIFIQKDNSLLKVGAYDSRSKIGLLGRQVFRLVPQDSKVLLEPMVRMN